MLVAMLCTFDRNGFSHHATNMIGSRHCVNKFELHPPNNSHVYYVRIIQTHPNQRELIFFSEFEIFKEY